MYCTRCLLRHKSQRKISRKNFIKNKFFHCQDQPDEAVELRFVLRGTVKGKSMHLAQYRASQSTDFSNIRDSLTLALTSTGV